MTVLLTSGTTTCMRNIYFDGVMNLLFNDIIAVIRMLQSFNKTFSRLSACIFSRVGVNEVPCNLEQWFEFISLHLFDVSHGLFISNR